MAFERKHIERIFRQKFNLNDQKKLEEYFQDDRLDGLTKEVVRNQWNDFEVDKSEDVSLDHIFYKLFYRIEENGDQKIKRRYLPVFQRAAAVLIVALLIAGAFYLGGLSTIGEDALTTEFYTPEGMRSQFKLPDGTSGWLGYNSKLQYTENDDDERLVSLDGQAYFNVTHNKDRSFVVASPLGLKVRVHGTRFNVNSYRGEKNFEVVLEKGSISVEDKKSVIDKLVPNEKFSYDAVTRKYKKSLVDVYDYVAWKEGKLIIHDEVFEKCCQKLGRFYNVEFSAIPNELKNQNVRLILQDETLEETLRVLGLIFPIRYTIKEREKLDNNIYTKRKVIIKMKPMR